MSQANIALFHAKVVSDPALWNTLTAGAASATEVAQRAVAAGRAQGVDFCIAEAEAWLAAEDGKGGEGELSDAQLEAVAGGGGSNVPGGAQVYIPILPSPPGRNTKPIN